MSTRNLIINNNNPLDNPLNNTINASMNYRRSLRFRRRWESFHRNGNSVENNSQRNTSNTSITENHEALTQRNTVSSTIELDSNMNISPNGSITSRQNH